MTEILNFAALHCYETGEFLRAATAAEEELSEEASRCDGGAGVFTAEVDGREIRAYVAP